MTDTQAEIEEALAILREMLPGRYLGRGVTNFTPFEFAKYKARVEAKLIAKAGEGFEEWTKQEYGAVLSISGSHGEAWTAARLSAEKENAALIQERDVLRATIAKIKELEIYDFDCSAWKYQTTVRNLIALADIAKEIP